VLMVAVAEALELLPVAGQAMEAVVVALGPLRVVGQTINHQKKCIYSKETKIKNIRTMKKIYLFAGVAAMMLASCSTEEQSNGYIAGSKVILNASLPNSGTRINEAASDTYGLVTNWSSDDSLDVLVNTNTIVPMTKSTGNTFTATPANTTVADGFNAGKTIYGVNNKSTDKITTALNGSLLKATLDFTGQDGTVSNLSKYDLMYGKGDPTGNITFNHKICVLRLDINSDALRTDGITGITGMKLKYVASTGTPLFASQEVYNFGAICDSTITSVDSIYLNNTNITVANGKVTVYVAVPHRQNLFGTLYVHLKGSNGTTSQLYDLTNAISMSNARMLMSTVHPLTVTGLSRTTRTVNVGVGDYLFSDGTWGSLVDNLGSAQPIAVVFSNKTSSINYGWTHGYAMALKNASTSVIWGSTETNPTGTFITTTPAVIADKDGHNHAVYTNSSTYPASYAAITYTSTVAAPSNTSSWFLPSSGQWYDILVNLGKMSATGYVDRVGWFYWGDQAACGSNLNAYLTPLTPGTYDTFPWNNNISYGYWSSTESDLHSVYSVMFYGNGSGCIGLGSFPKSEYYRVRPVIAF